MIDAQVRAFVGAISALTALAVPSSAQAVTGQELLRHCEALERGAVISGETVRLPKNQDAARCWVYMSAVQDFSATVEESNGRLFSTSVAVGSAKREEGSIRPGFVNRPGDHRVGD